MSVLRDIREMKIRTWLAPFMVEGSRALIELGYEAGFGARNSMGLKWLRQATYGARRREKPFDELRCRSSFYIYVQGEV